MMLDMARKNPHAVALGRRLNEGTKKLSAKDQAEIEKHAALLGKKGGKARAENLTTKEIRDISSKAGKARLKQISAEDRKAIASHGGLKGGKKGGLARAKALSPARRREIAIKANKARNKKRATAKQSSS